MATPHSESQTMPAQLDLTSMAPIFTCNDVNHSAAWYRDVLGFAIVDEWKTDDGTVIGVQMRAGDIDINLAQDDFAKGREREKGVGFRLYCMTEQDVDLLASSIQEQGGVLAAEPTTLPWGDRVFAVSDPDGFMISIASSRQE